MRISKHQVHRTSHFDAGFTLIELMIVVVVVAILASVALPSYQKSVLKSRRAEAQAVLLDLQLKQEKYFASTNAYVDTATLGVPTAHSYYTFAVTLTGTTQYELSATAKTGTAQVKDTGCTPLTLNQLGVKGPAGCWAS